MTSTVTLPLWLVVVVGVLSLMAALDHLLLPSARWVMRRRLHRAIDELNTRLKLRIQPFKLARRQSLIDQLVFDPEVLREIETYAAAHRMSRAAAQDLAREYAREIVPSFSAYAYFGIGARIARFISTALIACGLATWTTTRLRRSIRIRPSSSSSTTAQTWTTCSSPTWCRRVRR